MEASSLGASSGSSYEPPLPPLQLPSLNDGGECVVKLEPTDGPDAPAPLVEESNMEEHAAQQAAEDREFEALRAEFTARAITEACRTKIRSLLPGYCSRRRSLRNGGQQTREPPGSSHFGAGSFGEEVSPQPLCGLEDGALSPAGGGGDSVASGGGGFASGGGSFASGGGGGSAASGCESPTGEAAPDLPDVTQGLLHRSWLPSLIPSFVAATPAIPNGGMVTLTSHMLPLWPAEATAAASAAAAQAFATNFKEEKIHRCQECQATFTRSSTLKRHVKLHRGIKDRPFKCNVCSASFAYNNHLKTHIRIHTGERPFPCDVCGAAFARSDGLKIHRRKHTGERPYSCAHCSARFAVAHHLKEHARTHSHSAADAAAEGSSDAGGGADAAAADAEPGAAARASSFMCRECGDELPSLAQLRRHAASHVPRPPQPPVEVPLPLPPPPLNGSSPSQAAAAAAYLDASWLAENAAAFRRTCPPSAAELFARCDEQTEMPFRRRRATATVNGRVAVARQQRSPPRVSYPFEAVDSSSDPPFKVERPPSLPAAEAERQQQQLPPQLLLLPPRHQQQPPLPWTAPLADAADAAAADAAAVEEGSPEPSLRQESPDGSEAAATTPSKKPFKCDLCPFSFQCRAHLATHMRIHTGERPYACADCGASFARPDGLKIHRRTHTGERPYPCGRCDARFSMAHHLRQHARRHTGEKPFMCAECGDDFSTANRLKQHRRVHTGEKPFECGVCKARFTWSDYLRVHMRTHTGERPYECGDCGAAFARSDILKVHRRTHTGERPYACRDCPAAFKTLGQLQSHGRTHHGLQAAAAAATGSGNVAGGAAEAAVSADALGKRDGVVEAACFPTPACAAAATAVPRKEAAELAGSCRSRPFPATAAAARPSSQPPSEDDDRATDAEDGGGGESMSFGVWSGGSSSDAVEGLSDSDGM